VKEMMMTTVFTPLIKGLSFALSTIDTSGNPLPAGETESGATIGIRADGDATHAPGNYQYLVVLAAGATSITPAAINTAIGKSLPPGNYWAAVDQTDMLDGAPSTSAWTTEVPFSILQPVVQPSPPTDFIVA